MRRGGKYWKWKVFTVCMLHILVFEFLFLSFLIFDFASYYTTSFLVQSFPSIAPHFWPSSTVLKAKPPGDTEVSLSLVGVLLLQMLKLTLTFSQISFLRSTWFDMSVPPTLYAWLVKYVFPSSKPPTRWHIKKLDQTYKLANRLLCCILETELTLVLKALQKGLV